MNQSGEARKRQTRFSLSQETITILTVGVALAGLILVSQGDMRAEGPCRTCRSPGGPRSNAH